jgi:hypothetical protein
MTARRLGIALLHRFGLCALLLAAYLWAWTPARTAWTTHLAGPTLTWAAPTPTAVTVRPQARIVQMAVDADTRLSYTAPAGVKFLLPGMVLLLVAPRRSWVGGFFAGHLALGGLVLVLLAGGATGSVLLLRAADFVQAYGVDAYSLAVPTLRWVQARKQA